MDIFLRQLEAKFALKDLQLSAHLLPKVEKYMSLYPELPPDKAAEYAECNYIFGEQLCLYP